MSSRSFRTTSMALVVAALVLPVAARAQSLRGSYASINRMYRHARAERLRFYETPLDVRRATRAGALVPLTPDANFTLAHVGYPVARPATRTFVDRFGAEYRARCGERLVVTSATRPATRQPPNSTPHSVHPTGMAVDLRKPRGAACLRWMRHTLLQLEGAGLIEVTEEFAPPHFHVAVYPTPYTRYVLARTPAPARAAVALASNPATPRRRRHYRVHRGDTLWGIARAHHLTVARLVTANHLDGAGLTPGQALVIPRGAAQ